MQQQLSTLCRLTPALVLLICLGQSCKEPALMYRPEVLKRDALQRILQEPGVTRIIFQNENRAKDRKGKKRHRYQLTAFKEMANGYQPIETSELFDETITGIPPVPIAIDKEGQTADFANYYLAKGKILPDTANGKNLLLLYPSLLGTSGIDSKYVKYEISFTDNASLFDVLNAQKEKYKKLYTKKNGAPQGDAPAPRFAARTIEALMLNPSPPRNAEEN